MAGRPPNPPADTEAAQLVHEITTARGWTDRQLAEASGAAVRTVTGWRNGSPVRPMALALLRLLAEAS